MEITEVTVDRYRFERTVGQRSAVKETTDTTSLLVEIEADGTSGTGEVPDVENPDEIPPVGEIESRLQGVLAGRDPRRINALEDTLREELDFGPERFHSFQQLTLGALDTALYDLVGNHYGVPVYQLLGGDTQDVSLCWVVFTGDGEDLSAMRAEVTQKVEEGFRNFKLKVGELPPEADERRIRAVREIAGDDAGVFLDAQGVWNTEEAVDHIERFADAGIDGVETPVGHPDRSVDAPGYYYDVPLLPEELATVRERVDVPIMEHVLDPAFGVELLRHDAVDVFTVEVCAVGITRTERILDVARSAGIDARLGSTVEFGPATLAGASLAAASPAVTYPSDLIGPLAYDEAVLAAPVEYGRGTLSPRNRPGLGISV